MQAAFRAGLPQPSGEGRAQGAIVLRGLQVPAGTTGAITLLRGKNPAEQDALTATSDSPLALEPLSSQNLLLLLFFFQ